MLRSMTAVDEGGRVRGLEGEKEWFGFCVLCSVKYLDGDEKKEREGRRGEEGEEDQKEERDS